MIDFNKPVSSDNRNFRKEDSGIKAHFDAVEKEAALFPKKNGVIVDAELVIFSDCPVCGLGRHDQLFTKYGFVHVQCKNCNHVFVWNRLRESVLLDLYSKSIADELSSVRRQHHAGLDSYWTRIYEKYSAYLSNCNINNVNLLDVGCGAGHFLSFCKKHTSFNLHGIDFCEHSYEFLSGIIGKNYYFKKTLEKIEFDKAFGIITLWGVFEHLYNPREVLKKCKKILDRHGRILILVPNLFSRAFAILGITNPTLNPRAHINFYTRRSMEYLCHSIGLSIEHVFQELPVIDLMYDYIDYNEQLVESILNKEEAYYHVYILKNGEGDK